MAYIGGWYYVESLTKNGHYFRKDFPTEREARVFGNAQWSLPYVVRVKIVKMGYYKKRRNSTLIAEAQKATDDTLARLIAE